MTATNQSFSTSEIRSTEAGGARAAWRVRGAEPAVMFVEDPSSDRPAVRWPDQRMPAVDPGHVAFDPDSYPSLTEVREILPEYATLWDAVAEDYREALAPERTPDCAAAQHAAFFALPA